MKTPDEIKKGLLCCENPNGNPTICEECPYKGTKGNCIDRLYAEARRCIQQLEADNSRLNDTIRSLTEQLNAAHEETAKAMRERDAALRDFKSFAQCKNNICHYCVAAEDMCGDCGWQYPNMFIWRGVCPENTEVQEDG